MRGRGRGPDPHQESKASRKDSDAVARLSHKSRSSGKDMVMGKVQGQARNASQVSKSGAGPVTVRTVPVQEWQGRPIVTGRSEVKTESQSVGQGQINKVHGQVWL